MPFLDAARRLFTRSADARPAADRRHFFRTAAGLGAGAAMGGLMMPDEAWAASEERAARFGITPGTVVDAQGRPMQPSSQITDPFIGLIIMVPYNFPPRGWAFCNGQLLSIAQNTALFSLLGTTYGGNGQTTFALPNLQGRFPMHWGNGPGLSPRSLGETAGSESVTLLSTQMPAHNHQITVQTDPGTTDSPSGAYPARPASSIPQYGTTPGGTLNAATVSAAGGSQPHDNMPPYQTVSFCIALQGIYPSRD